MIRITRSGLTFALIGAFILTIRVLLDELTILDTSLLGKISLDLLRDIGVGFIVLGIFNLILSRADWQEYFESRLRSIVTDHNFLRRLDRSALRQLVRAAIKAQAPGAAVEREGGFLEYFEDHLHQFIFGPYRENATAEISYADDADPSVFFVVDKFSYVARSVGGILQDSIRFELDASECIGGGEVTITIKLPERSSEPGKVVSLVERKPLQQVGGGGYEVNVSIPREYVTLDGLEVVVEASYKGPRDRIQTWWMLTPTRDLRVILSFPWAYEINIKEFVQAEQLANWTRRPGYVLFRYPSWFLPGNGLVWEFFQRAPGASPTAVQAAEPPRA